MRMRNRHLTLAQWLPRARSVGPRRAFAGANWLSRSHSIGRLAFAMRKSLTRAVPRPSAWRPAHIVHSYRPAPSGPIVSRLPGGSNPSAGVAPSCPLGRPFGLRKTRILLGPPRHLESQATEVPERGGEGKFMETQNKKPTPHPNPLPVRGGEGIACGRWFLSVRHRFWPQVVGRRTK